MIVIRRRTRETLRHERAVVIHQLTTPTLMDIQADVAANQCRAAELRRVARRWGKY